MFIRSTNDRLGILSIAISVSVSVYISVPVSVRVFDLAWFAGTAVRRRGNVACICNTDERHWHKEGGYEEGAR